MDSARWKLVIVGVASACRSSAAVPDATGPVDSAADARADAELSDAAPGDAPGLGLVTVHVLGRREVGGPLSGVPVVFQDAEGTVLGGTTTDALGIARGRVPAGASITVVEAAARRLTTIMGVADGDVLLVGDVGEWSLFPIGSATISVPAAPQGNTYVIQGPCALSGFSSSTAVGMTLWDACGIAPRPVVVESFDPNPSNVLRAWLYGQVTLEPGSSVTLAGTWMSPVPFQIALTGIPYANGFADLNVTRYLGAQPIYTAYPGSLVVAGNALTATPLQTSAGDGVVTQLSLQDSFGRHNEIVEYRHTAATSLAGDVTGDLISWPSDTEVVTGELSPGGPTGITGGRWTMHGSGDYDGFSLDFLAVDDAFTEYHWSVVMPPGPAGAVEVRLPRLPPDLVALWANRTYENLTIIAADTPVTSYAEFRRDAAPLTLWSWMLWPTAPRKVRLGRAG
jgi:hypothetical protein